MFRVRLLGLSVLLALLMGCAGEPGTPPPPPRPNLLLVTVDTLRADRVRPDLTPTLDRLAATGVRFTNARSVAPLTLPAHVSIMTGLLPPTHGVRLNGTVFTGNGDTLAMRLKRLGYRTLAVVGAFVLDRRFGLARGFDVYDDDIRRDAANAERLEAERPATAVIDRAIATLRDSDPAAPYFLWVHLYDPHAPYVAPGNSDTGASAYDAEVRFVDHEVARLLRAIQQQRPEPTATIVAGDHGEGLGEHGESTHGMLLFDSTLRVPLIIAAPGLTAATRTDAVSLVDIAPSALAIAGETTNDRSLAGQSLLAPVDAPREIYAETDYPVAAGWRRGRALVQGRYKLISSGGTRLFDISVDATERDNLAGVQSAAATSLTARVERIEKAVSRTQAASPVTDRQTAAQLQSLGYVATGLSSEAGDADADDAADHTETWAAFERALAARARRDLDEAERILAALARAQSAAPLFATTYAQVLSAQRKPHDAVRILERLIRETPPSAEVFHELAVVAREAGQRDAAVRAETAALQLDPSLARAHHGFGLLQADSGDHRAAASAFEQAAKHDPNNATYWSDLGNARRALGDLAGARNAYESALSRDKTLADAANGFGAILVQQGRATEAIQWFQQAIAADANFVEAHLNLGIALQESGQRDLALARYRVVERLAREGTAERAAARTLRQQLEARR
jgi:choline-sulfatase